MLCINASSGDRVLIYLPYPVVERLEQHWPGLGDDRSVDPLPKE